MRGRLFIVAVVALTIRSVWGQGNCEFSEFKFIEVPRESITDENTWFDRRNHIATKPVYPPDARAKRDSGTVHVRVLIDRNGKVVKTCPVYPAKEPVPSQALVDAAVATVRRARFRRNFGRTAGKRVPVDYALSTIDIHFQLASNEK